MESLRNPVRRRVRQRQNVASQFSDEPAFRLSAGVPGASPSGFCARQDRPMSARVRRASRWRVEGKNNVPGYKVVQSGRNG